MSRKNIRLSTKIKAQSSLKPHQTDQPSFRWLDFDLEESTAELLSPGGRRSQRTSTLHTPEAMWHSELEQVLQQKATRRSVPVSPASPHSESSDGLVYNPEPVTGVAPTSECKEADSRHCVEAVRESLLGSSALDSDAMDEEVTRCKVMASIERTMTAHTRKVSQFGGLKQDLIDEFDLEAELATQLAHETMAGIHTDYKKSVVREITLDDSTQKAISEHRRTKSKYDAIRDVITRQWADEISALSQDPDKVTREVMKHLFKMQAKAAPKSSSATVGDLRFVVEMQPVKSAPRTPTSTPSTVVDATGDKTPTPKTDEVLESKDASAEDSPVPRKFDAFARFLPEFRPRKSEELIACSPVTPGFRTSFGRIRADNEHDLKLEILQKALMPMEIEFPDVDFNATDGCECHCGRCNSRVLLLENEVASLKTQLESVIRSKNTLAKRTAVAIDDMRSLFPTAYKRARSNSYNTF